MSELDGQRLVPNAPNAPNAAESDDAVLLRVDGLQKYFVPRGRRSKRHRTGHVRAVDGVTFDLRQGETLALVGESGSGKSTTARAIMRFIEPTAGHIWFRGTDLAGLSRRALRSTRRHMQLVFQDPIGSLNPRMTVREILAEPFEIHERNTSKAAVSERLNELLTVVGLDPDRALERYPHQFSGGQRQRIAIARALALRPELVILDEPVSALDVSIQAQIVNLLVDLKEAFSLSYLVISHDLSLIRHVADRVAVMYLGRIVEFGETEQVFDAPTHPYTAALLSAVPVPDPAVGRDRKRIMLRGDVPDPSAPPSGCHFHTRCWMAEARCELESPELVHLQHDPERMCSCHFPLSLRAHAETSR